MSKLLILGASSSVGRHLWNRLGPDRAIGTYRAHAIDGGRRFDSVSMRLAEVVRPGEASHAVILVADPQPDSCVRDPQASRRLNVEAMTRLIQDIWTLGMVPIFASTDYVFDGVKGNYVETDQARPILLYGAQKLEVEDFLTTSGQPHAILRLSKVYGDVPGDGTLFAAWLDTILKGATTIRCATDQAFSPVHVGDVGDAFVAAAERGLSGLFHCTGNQRFTRLELLELLITEIRRYRPVKMAVEHCSIHDFSMPEKRPVDTSMVAGKLMAATSLKPLPVEERVRRLVTRAIQGDAP